MSLYDLRYLSFFGNLLDCLTFFSSLRNNRQLYNEPMVVMFDLGKIHPGKKKLD